MQQFNEFIQRYPIRKFEKDQILLVQGDTPRDIYVVHSGFIKGYDISTEGVEQLIWLGSSGDIFPYPWLFTATDNSELFYSAFTYLEVYVVNKKEFIEFLQANPKVLFYVTTHLAKAYAELIEKLTATEKPKASEKLVAMLNLLANRFSDNDGGNQAEINVPLTQQDIANLLGLTRETVATELKKLKDAGYVYYDKWHFVVYTDKLATLL